MKKITAILIAVTATATLAFAEPYAGIAMNYYKITDAADGTFAPELTVGGSFGKMLRAEGAFSFDRYDFVVVDVKTTTIMGNLYADFASEDKKMIPFVMGGVGYANAKTDPGGINEGGWMGQLGGGLALKVGKSGAVDFKYRYQFSKSYDLGFGQNFRLSGHCLGVGYRYSF